MVEGCCLLGTVKYVGVVTLELGSQKQEGLHVVLSIGAAD